LLNAVDKLADLFQYLVAAHVLQYGLPTYIKPLVMLLIAWRSIGVGLFIAFKDTRWLVPFFDGIKETMVAYQFVSPQGLIAVCFAKVVFEFWKNWHVIIWN
jgi:hypothetical protein